jgi:TolB-like protein
MLVDYYYEFGHFRLHPSTRQLLRQGEAVALTAKVFDLLLLLVEHRGELLERESLMNALWPNAIVEESNSLVTPLTAHDYKQQLITAIAILPLKAISAQKPSRDKLHYLGTGIADSIIAALSRATGLIVRPTTAILKYGTFGQDPMQAGRELKVEVVLDGTLQQVGEALHEFQQVQAQHSQQSLALTAHTLALAARPAEARAILTDLQRRAREQYVSPYCLALMHVALGELDEACDLLAQASAERAAWMIFLPIDPFWTRLRGNERFEILLR